nr:hypothetical protein [uncultured Allomuricauda sp.]
MKTYKNFTYRIFNSEFIEITGVTNNPKRVTIPNKIEGLKVTHIGNGAFDGNQITELDLKQVTHIGNGAFRGNVRIVKGNQSIRMVDGIATVLRKKRNIDGFQVSEGKFFNRNKKCYVATKGDFSAHGGSLREAIDDVNFKYLQENQSVEEIVSEVKEKGVMNVGHFRLITGACRMGCKNFLDQKGIKETELPLKKPLKLLEGQFGWGRIQELFI